MAKATPGEDFVPLKVERKATKSEAFMSLYANDTQLQTTIWDMRLIFGVITNVPTPSTPVMEVDQIAEVRMSIQHAKKLATMLTEQVRRYETKIGPILVPEE